MQTNPFHMKCMLSCEFYQMSSMSCIFSQYRTSIQTFTAHQKQCCFYADLSRFNEFPLLGTEPPVNSLPGLPHPALTNAIYLLGCHFARSPLCSDLQPGFMKQTLHEIVQSLRNPEPLIDVIQASCLLAQYFYFNGRAIEGYRHSFAATRMSVGLGLHQIRPPDLQSESVDDFMSHDWGTISDRITVFWQIFVVDRLWSAANGLITALPDEKSACRRITTPLPTSSFMQVCFFHSILFYFEFERISRTEPIALPLPYLTSSLTMSTSQI